MKEKEVVISLKGVYKSYIQYHYIKAGLKTFLFNLPQAIRDIRKKYTVLEDITFEVYRGECLGILGRNGAGKSTLLGLIAGVIKPDRGNIYIKGRVYPMLELGAGFHPELTGRENIILSGVLMGVPLNKMKEKIDRIIQFSEIEEVFIDQPVRTYSSGMLARLGFSIIANIEPEILLIDEVLAVGDIGFQRKCIDKIKEFKQERVTIVFVSHIIEQVEELCDRVVWIENHRVKMVGSPSEVCSAYKEYMLGA